MTTIASHTLASGVSSAAASFQLANGDLRIYYQSSDGAIQERTIKGATYHGQVISADQVLVNTPIAVTALADGKFLIKRINLYFIDKTYHLREYVFTPDKWGPGTIDKEKYKVAPATSLLYATSTPDGKIRVGFQDADKPNVITEASTSADGKWSKAPLVN